jgi:hypothetical protein
MAIVNTDTSWDCTHYINDPDDLNSDWINKGFDLQGFNKKIFGISVRRLFIFDNKEDINKDALNLMEWQKSIGIEIKILILKENAIWSGYDRLKKILGTIDIAIINKAYLISFLLDDVVINNKNQRRLSYVEFWSELEKVKEVQHIYNDMWNSSLTIEQVQNTYNIDSLCIDIKH